MLDLSGDTGQKNEGNAVKWQTLLDTYALIPLQ